MRRLVRNTSGASAIEFALLSPLYLLLLLGMAAYGIYLGASHSIQQIAADAAREAIAGLSAVERQAIVTDYVARHAGGYSFVDADKLAIDVSDAGPGGTQFAVAVTYDARHLPIWGLFEGLPIPEVTIARRAVIRIGGI